MECKNTTSGWKASEGREIFESGENDLMAVCERRWKDSGEITKKIEIWYIIQGIMKHMREELF